MLQSNSGTHVTTRNVTPEQDQQRNKHTLTHLHFQHHPPLFTTYIPVSGELSHSSYTQHDTGFSLKLASRNSALPANLFSDPWTHVISSRYQLG